MCQEAIQREKIDWFEQIKIMNKNRKSMLRELNHEYEVYKVDVFDQKEIKLN